MSSIPTETLIGDPIESQAHLLHVLKDGKTHSFKLMLNGGGYSRKEIYVLANGKYDLHNCIDDTWQTLGAKQLFMAKHTGLLNEAIKAGSLIYDGTN